MTLFSHSPQKGIFIYLSTPNFSSVGLLIFTPTFLL